MTSASRLLAALCAAAGVLAESAAAQDSGFDFTYGRWLRDPATITYTLGVYSGLMGPLDYGIAIHHVDDTRSALDRTLSGGEVSLGFRRDGHGPYAVASLGVGMRHEDGNLDTQWSAGAGYAVRLLPFLSLGLETRYRVEDQDSRGFWRLRSDDRRGFLLQVRVAAGGPLRRGRPPVRHGDPCSNRPSREISRPSPGLPGAPRRARRSPPPSSRPRSPSWDRPMPGAGATPTAMTARG